MGSSYKYMGTFNRGNSQNSPSYKCTKGAVCRFSSPFLQPSRTNIQPRQHDDPTISTILGVFSGAIISRICRRASGTFPPDEVTKDMPLKAFLANAAVTLAAPATDPKLLGTVRSCVRGNARANVHVGEVLQDAGESSFDEHSARLTLHMVLTPKDIRVTG